MRNKPSILLPILITLAGCAGAPPQFEPKPVEPAGTLAAYETRTLVSSDLKAYLEKNLGHEVTPWPPPSWDLPLLTLVAFYYHPDLDVARAQWAVAEAGKITAGMRPNPSLNASFQYNRDAVGGASPWTWGLGLDIPIETAGRRDYRVTEATYLSAAARLRIAAAAWQVRSRVRMQWVEVYAARQREALLQRQLATQEKIVQVLERRLAAGMASRPEVIQAHLAREQTRLALAEVRRQGTDALVQLAGALGLSASALEGRELSFNGLDEIRGLETDTSMLRRAALLSRADLLAALADYGASQSALQLALAQSYPDVHLGPGYTWDAGAVKWSLGLSAVLPLFNRNQGPVAETEARRTEQAARFTALQARIESEIDRALAAYHTAVQKLETAADTTALQQRQRQATAAQFDAGEADRLALLGADLEQDAAELARIEAWVQAQQARGQLEDALQHPLDTTTPLSAVPETDPRTRMEMPQ